jgi:HD-GYP domain-containing protein (c-di-GMP phosphodiesterase class II)
LHAIDLVITSNLDLRLTMRLFLEQVVPQLGADAGSVLLLNPYTQTLEYGAGWGFNTEIIERSELRLGEGAAGQAAQERRMVILSPIDQPGSPFLRRELVSDERFVFYCAVPLIGKGQVKGVLELFLRRAFTPEEEWKEFLDALAVQAAIAIDNATLFKELQDSNAELILAYDTTIEGWSHALELRDKETEGHTQRATATTIKVARAMAMKEEQLVHVRRGALLHDIGKMVVPDTILLKDGPLTPEEQAVMRQHPRYAFELLSPIAYLRPAIDIPYCHHEWWDGSGYPRGLKGEQIPLAARIFAIADTWDALTSARRYHPAWSPEKATAHIEALAGSQFDPALVARFFAVINSGEGGREKERS